MAYQPQTPNKISTANSRTASTLASGEVFQGVSEDVSKFGRAGISISSTNQSNGILTIEVSHDNVTFFGPDRTIADTKFAQPPLWQIVEKYFRIKYTNNGTEAVNFSIQVQYSNNGSMLLGHQLNEELIDETGAIVTRSVLVGKTVNGSYVNALMTPEGELLASSRDFSAAEVLKTILLESKLTNAYLALIADEVIKPEDLES